MSEDAEREAYRRGIKATVATLDPDTVLPSLCPISWDCISGRDCQRCFYEHIEAGEWPKGGDDAN
jgi:hypothetical protein